MKLKQHFTTERRMIAAILAAVGTYFLAGKIVGLLGFDYELEKATMVYIVIASVLSAFITKWIHQTLKVSKEKD